VGSAVGMGIWGPLLVVIWCVAFLIFPLVNRDRMRLGDLLAGTIVVSAPRVRLLGDLAAKIETKSASDQRDVTFQPEHLKIYGIYELQVLEDVLRIGKNDDLARVRKQVAAKINWGPDVTNDRRFLEEFYREQRAQLEGAMILGKRRERKIDA